MLYKHKWYFLSLAVPCPVGEFSRSGLMPCYPCPQDYYQPNPGKSFCLSCPFYGTTTITGARSITDCSSKMTLLHFSRYPVWESFISTVTLIATLTMFSAFRCLDVSCPLKGFLMTMTQILHSGNGELHNLQISKSLEFNDMSHLSLMFCLFM